MSNVQGQTAKTLIGCAPRPQRGFASTVQRALGSAFDTMLLWQQRAAERHHLASLGEHHLKDIGLSRADVEYESSKPFWRS